MSEAITPGQSVPYAVYERLLRESIGRKRDNKALKASVDELTGERDTLRASVGTITTERDGLLSKLTAAPSELQARNDALTTELRTIRHKSVFDKVADAAKVKSEAKGDLWDALKYTPDGDDADEARITGLVTEALKARGYMVQADTPDGGGAADAAKGGASGLGRGPGPGAARGGAPIVLPSDPRVAAVESLKATTGQSNPFRIA